MSFTPTTKTAVGGEGVRPSSSRRSRTGREEYRTATLFLALPLAIFAFLKLAPDVANFYYAFTDWTSYHDSIKFVGLTNISYMLQEGEILHSIQVTLIFALVATVVQTALALALALALEHNTRFNVLMRGVFFLPVLFSGLAAGYIFRGILDPNGPLNHALSLITGHTVGFPWLGDLTWTLCVVACLQAWKGFPVAMIVFVAGLTTVPDALVESARVEGANTWQVLRHVKIPLLAPAFTFNLVTTLIGALGAGVDILVATTNGGPGDATLNLGLFTLTRFGNGNFAEATAAQLILFIWISVFAIPAVILLRRREVAL